MSDPIHIDGSLGEGGGQVVRSSLALAMVTGRPLHLTSIRAGRRKPGLLRQHLTALRASAAISDGTVEGDALGSREVVFRPGPVRAGQHRFAIGSAGSANLVVQTILPALWYADGPSQITVEGGTHNDRSPTSDVLVDTFLPTLRRIGPVVAATLHRPGFHPAGGGSLRIDVQPSRPTASLDLVERGPVDVTVDVLTCNLPAEVGQRTLRTLLQRLPTAAGTARDTRGPGPGHVFRIVARTPTHTETFTGFVDHQARVDRVVRDVTAAFDTWMTSGAVVGEHTADQLLLPMALAGGGRFTTVAPTRHTTTNVEVVGRFLPVAFTIDEPAPGRWMITARSRSPGDAR